MSNMSASRPRMLPERASMDRWILILTVGVAATACGPSPEDHVAQLAGDGADRAAAKRELLLAKDQSVEPLLAALGEAEYAPARPELVDVLFSLMTRVDDPRIPAALIDRLQRDADPRVRSRVARGLGMQSRSEGIPVLLDAVGDDAGEVRHQALLALGLLQGKLTAADQERLQEQVRGLVGDAHEGVRLEAMIRVEDFVDEWIEQARQAALKAELSRADTLYGKALAYAPNSKRANYRLGRYYYDNDQRQRGLDLLQRHGMLLEVPRLGRAPQIDGRLDEDVWREAARADSFFQFSFGHKAALPTKHPAAFYLGYTDQALFIGFYGHDDNPDSLVTKIRRSEDQDAARQGEENMQVEVSQGGGMTITSGGGGLQSQIWTDDVIELFIDPNFDHQTYAHMGINSAGVISEQWIKGSRFNRRPEQESWMDESWKAGGEVAAHIGADFWSVEYRLDLGSKEFPRPAPEAIWGFNVVRVFRGAEYSQWVRTYSGGHSPDDFGLLRFK